MKLCIEWVFGRTPLQKKKRSTLPFLFHHVWKSSTPPCTATLLTSMRGLVIMSFSYLSISPYLPIPVVPSLDARHSQPLEPRCPCLLCCRSSKPPPRRRCLRTSAAPWPHPGRRGPVAAPGPGDGGSGPGREMEAEEELGGGAMGGGGGHCCIARPGDGGGGARPDGGGATHDIGPGGSPEERREKHGEGGRTILYIYINSILLLGVATPIYVSQDFEGI